MFFFCRIFGLETGPPQEKMEALNAKVSEAKTLLADPVNPSDETALSIRLSNISVSCHIKLLLMKRTDLVLDVSQ